MSPRPGREGPGREGPGREGRGPGGIEGPCLPDDVSGDEIDSWLFGDSASVSADQPTAVYGGDTITITAFKDASAAPPKVQPPPSASDDEYERQAEEVEEPVEEAAETADALLGEQNEDEDDEEEGEEDEDAAGSPGRVHGRFQPLLCGQESSTATGQETGPTKPSFKDTSDAAGDILRRLMERRARRKTSEYGTPHRT